MGTRDENEDGWLGIEFQPRHDGHLVITKIVEGGSADGTKSVMVGDIIVGIRGFFARALVRHSRTEGSTMPHICERVFRLAADGGLAPRLVADAGADQGADQGLPRHQATVDSGIRDGAQK